MSGTNTALTQTNSKITLINTECLCAHLLAEISQFELIYCCIRRIFFPHMRGVFSILNSYFWLGLKLKLKLHKRPFPLVKRFEFFFSSPYIAINRSKNEHFLTSTVFFNRLLLFQFLSATTSIFFSLINSSIL